MTNPAVLFSVFLSLLLLTPLPTHAEAPASAPSAELEKKAEQGDTEAQLSLAEIYYKGIGVEKNFKKAAHWYRALGDKGFAQAQLTLGLMYIKGQGVVQNDAEAIKWLTLAADQLLPSAQHLLGVAYEEGHGVKVDLVRAYMWYEIASALEYKNAVEARDALAPQLTPAQIKDAEQKASDWWLQHHH